MTKEKIKLSNLLEGVEFDYKINDDKTLSLIDLLGANLGNIESDTFEINESLAINVIERLERYIHDYFIDGYITTLKEECNEIMDENNYADILTKMKKHVDKFKNCIDLMYAIINPNLFDISDIVEEKEITAKCPRCGSRLYKFNNSEKAYCCKECQESFYAFECMGIVICTNKLMQNQTNNVNLQDVLLQQHDQ